MAKVQLSGRHGIACVSRNHLQDLVHPSARRAEKEADRTSRAHTCDAPVSSHHTQKTDNCGQISDAVSIRERPATVEDRAVPGHWEGDLLFGSANRQIATLVERHTCYVMLVKTARKDTQTVVDALIKHARKLPQELYKSLTWDRRKELADHKRFTL
ncbi:IS30 family transposase [Herbaspirillum seropedicae]|uniref:IS30 family transposase n=1 Tax=Herbaspirillum seropedicae TaxID=964 RepID=UPI0035B55CFB